MKRRTLIRQLGTGAVATAAFVGSASADRGPVGLDRRIDVSDLEGRVPMVEVLDESDLAALDDRIDPEETTFHIGAGVQYVNPGVGDDECDIRPDCCDECPDDCDVCTCKNC